MIFVENRHHSGEAPSPFPDRATLIGEVKSVRRHHNPALDSVIEDVAAFLRRSSIDEQELDRMLINFPDRAAAFWQPESVTV